MMHLSSENIYRLAELVTRELAFREEDAADMRHVGECEQCYRRLCSAMAMMDVLDHPENALLESVYAAPKREENKKRRARICLRVERGCTVFETCEAGAENWPFAVRKAVAAHSGAAVQCPSQRVEDPENSENCLVYDPERELLEIRLAVREGENPRCTLISGGREIPVTLEKCRDGLRGGIRGLKEGKYHILLEK